MGVDWYPCKSCGKTFPDSGHYVSCPYCRTHWCNYKCAEKDGYMEDQCKLGYEVIEGYEQNEECEESDKNSCFKCDNYIKGGCKYCRQEDFEDVILLDYLLQSLNKTREELITEYKKTL